MSEGSLYKNWAHLALQESSLFAFLTGFRCYGLSKLEMAALPSTAYAYIIAVPVSCEEFTITGVIVALHLSNQSRLRTVSWISVGWELSESVVKAPPQGIISIKRNYTCTVPCDEMVREIVKLQEPLLAWWWCRPIHHSLNLGGIKPNVACQNNKTQEVHCRKKKSLSAISLIEIIGFTLWNIFILEPQPITHNPKHLT